MKLPVCVRECMALLENAGHTCYAVGGCVRDWLLGLTPHDYDLCTDATPEQMQRIFSGYQLVLAGEKHGTVGVVCGREVVEITTFRTEGDYKDNRHPDSVRFVSRVEEDLARRDFTVNAMAWSPSRGLVDPFGGARDLKNRQLRAVGDPENRFREDSLRILRGVRFSLRFRLMPDEDTLDAMLTLAPLMDNLARERVMDELTRLLLLASAEDLLFYAPIITQVIPELRPCVGFQQHNSHHIYDVYAHIAHVVENVPAQPALRWAALLHDVGKPATFTLDEDGKGHFYGHAAVSAELADGILLRLKAPTALRAQVVTLIAQHMSHPIADKKFLRRRLSKLGADTLEQLLALQEADIGGKSPRSQKELAVFAQSRVILSELLAENSCLHIKDLAVNGHDLMALGHSGRAIGDALNHLLELVLDEKLPNRRQDLLNYLQNHFGGNL